MTQSEPNTQAVVFGKVLDLPEAGVEPSFLPHPLMDRLIEVVLSLGAELWTEKDRRQALEQILLARGIIAADSIEQLRFTAEQEVERTKQREQFVQRIYATLAKV